MILTNTNDFRCEFGAGSVIVIEVTIKSLDITLSSVYFTNSKPSSIKLQTLMRFLASISIVLRATVITYTHIASEY